MEKAWTKLSIEMHNLITSSIFKWRIPCHNFLRSILSLLCHLTQAAFVDRQDSKCGLSPTTISCWWSLRFWPWVKKRNRFYHIERNFFKKRKPLLTTHSMPSELLQTFQVEGLGRTWNPQSFCSFPCCCKYLNIRNKQLTVQHKFMRPISNITWGVNKKCLNIVFSHVGQFHGNFFQFRWRLNREQRMQKAKNLWRLLRQLEIR